MVTLALGVRYRLVEGFALAGRSSGVDVGATYEWPISNSGDLSGWRITSVVVLWMR